MHATRPRLHRVLVIDDDQIMRDVLHFMLGAAGYEVMAAHSGEEALAMLAAENNFDVVLTDVHMPGLRGAALARRLTDAMHASGILLGMSGSAVDDELSQVFPVFLQKPFTTEEFEAAAEHAASSQSTQTRLVDEVPSMSALDETIFARLAGMVPVAQLRELYNMTVGDVERRVLLMRTAAKDGDAALCRAEAHSIKGGCGMVGALELSALAARTEMGPLPDSKVFQEFDSACERLRRMLMARIG